MMVKEEITKGEIRVITRFTCHRFSTWRAFALSLTLPQQRYQGCRGTLEPRNSRNLGTSSPSPLWKSSIQRLWIQRLQLWIFFKILLTFVLVRSGEALRLESASLACHSHFRCAHPFQSDQYRTPSSSTFVGQTKTHCSHHCSACNRPASTNAVCIRNKTAGEVSTARIASSSNL